MSEMPCAERPRERLAREGTSALKTNELLAILLRTGIQGANVNVVGEELFRRFGSLEALSRASLDALRSVRGVGRDKAVTLQAAFELGRRLSRERLPEAPSLETAARVADLLREEAATWNTERLVVLMVNARCRLIRVETVTEGLLDQVLVHAREVFRPAIAAGAHAVLLAHNHPSGDPTPSDNDIRVTRDLIRAGALLRVEVLDHVVLGRPGMGRARDYESLRELGHFHR